MSLENHKGCNDIMQKYCFNETNQDFWVIFGINILRLKAHGNNQPNPNPT